MPTASLPQKKVTLTGLVESLGEADAFGGSWDGFVVQMQNDSFIEVDAMAFLCAWGKGCIKEGRRLLLRGDDDTLRYLARMDLHDHLGIDYDPGARQDETGRFLPLKLIGSGDDVYEATNAICELILNQFDEATTFLPALEWAVNEIIDNIMIHSETPVPGTVCAQYFPKIHRLDVGICDLGCGIKASLGTRHGELRGHGHAVSTALKRGITRDPEVGQGNGMAGALEISNRNHGEFSVWTGDVHYSVKDGREPRFSKIPEVPGTGVMFRLDTRHPVDLSETWIAGGDWGYINVEAQRIEKAGGD